MANIKIICVVLTGVIGVILFILGFMLAFKVFPDLIEDEIAKVSSTGFADFDCG